MFHWSWDDVQHLPASVRLLALDLMREWGDTEGTEPGISLDENVIGR